MKLFSPLLLVSLLLFWLISGRADDRLPALSAVQQLQLKDVDDAFAVQDFEKVGRICREMDAADSLNPLILQKCAATFFRQGKFRIASEYLRRQLKLFPTMLTLISRWV